MLTVKDFSDAFDVKGNTVRTWTAEFYEYLSEEANPPKGQARLYSPEDAKVIALIGEMRTEYASYNKIHAALADGGRGRWPPPFREAPAQAEVPDEPTQAVIVTRLTATVAQFEGELRATKSERDRLARDLTSEREARIEAEKEASRLAGKLEAIEDRPPRRWRWPWSKD